MTNVRTRQIEANGLTFIIDEAGDSDDVMLFLHGFPESRRSWRRQLPFIAGLGWRAVAVDMRGYGQSSRPKSKTAYRLDHLTDDVGALFDALQAKRRVLVGHDWGGIIAWTTAIWRTRPLDGLVIMNAPHPAAYAAHVRRSFAQMMRSWYVLYFQLPWLPEAMTTAGRGRVIERAFVNSAADPAAFAQDDLEHYRDNAVLPGAMTAMINYYRANALALSQADRTMNRRIETPTLLIWGEKDPFLGVDLMELCRPYVADLTVSRLPEISHWVQQEAPERVNKALAAWLQDNALVSR